MPTYLILFPRAWGNRTEEIVRWWFQAVIAFAQERFGGDIIVLPMVYKAADRWTSMDDYAGDCLEQLRAVEIPEGARVIGVAYSMGGQVMRLTAAKWTGRFSDQILIATCGPKGLRFTGLVRGVMAIAKAFTLGAIFGWVKLTQVQEIYDLFFDTHSAVFSTNLCAEVLKNSHPEPSWTCLRLGVWPFRQRVPPLPGKVHMIVPAGDILFREELGSRNTYGEDWKIIAMSGGHGEILIYNAMADTLHHVNWSG